MRLADIEVGGEYVFCGSQYWPEATWVRRVRVVEVVTREVEGRYSWSPKKKFRFLKIEDLDPKTGEPDGTVDEVAGRYLHDTWEEHVRRRDRDRDARKRRNSAYAAANEIEESGLFPSSTSVSAEHGYFSVKTRLDDEAAVRAFGEKLRAATLDAAIEEVSGAKAIEAGFQVEWASGERKDDGTAFGLSCGAGCGSRKMVFSAGSGEDRRYFLLDAEDLVSAFFRKLDASPAPEDPKEEE